MTGAAKGIGRAVTERFIDEGASVVAMDVDSAGLLSMESDLAAGAALTTHRVDVGDPGMVERVCTDVAATHPSIHVLVNNAGVQHPGPLAELDVGDWDRLLAVNLRSAYLLLRGLTPLLRAGAPASVVNVASVDGFVGEANVAAYCAAKAGLVNLTRAVAMELAADGIRVNAVCPGMTDTPMLRGFLSASPTSDADLAARLRRVPGGRLVQPADVAAAVAFLASDEAMAITGAAVPIDHGLLAGWDFGD